MKLYKIKGQPFKEGGEEEELGNRSSKEGQWMTAADQITMGSGGAWGEIWLKEKLRGLNDT